MRSVAVLHTRSVIDHGQAFGRDMRLMVDVGDVDQKFFIDTPVDCKSPIQKKEV